MGCFETVVKAASMIGVNDTSSSAKQVTMLRNFTFPVICQAFMWCSFQFYETWGHLGSIWEWCCSWQCSYNLYWYEELSLPLCGKYTAFLCAHMTICMCAIIVK